MVSVDHDPTVSADHDPFAPPPPRTFPRSPSQAYAWLHRGSTDSKTLLGKEFLCLSLSGPVDEMALAHALGCLPDFHEALRGRFDRLGATFKIEGRMAVAPQRFDLSAMVSAQRSAGLSELLGRFNSEPFDLAAGPLFRSAIVRMSPTEVAVLLVAQQAVCDGWSMDVMLADLARLYSAFVGAEPLPAPPHGVSDYLRYRASEPFAARERASRVFWERALGGASLMAVEAAAPRPARALREATRVLPTELVAAARAYARKQGVSFFAVLLATYRALLARVESQRTIRISVPIAGHPEAGLEDCVGPLAAHLPIIPRESVSDTLDSTCTGIFSALLDAREHSAFDAGLLAEAVSPDADAVLSARFAHVQKYAPNKLRFAGCTWDYVPVPAAHDDHEVSLVAFESTESVTLSLSVAAEGHDPDWPVLRLCELARLLAYAVDSPQRPMHAFDLSALGQAGARAPQPTPGGRTESAHRQAARTPIVVPMQSGASGAVPVFCLFGIQLYVDLAKALGDLTPVMFMHIPMIYVPSREARPGLGEVVEHYVRAIREIRPRGPYALAGLCLGGVVAYGVARELRQAGEDVRLVTVLDALLPQGRHVDQRSRLHAGGRKLLDAAGKTLRRAVGQTLRGESIPADAGFGVGEIARRILGRAAAPKSDAPVDLAFDSAEAREDVAGFAGTRPYLDAAVLVARATGFPRPSWEKVDPDMGWKALAREVQTVDVDCDHLEIVRPPHVQRVADSMLSLLRRAAS